MDDFRQVGEYMSMVSRDLILLSTEHCSLCEQALDMLVSMPELRGLPLHVVDVAEDEALLDRYGPRLPVLAVAGHELDWPFSRKDVVAAVAGR